MAEVADLLLLPIPFNYHHHHLPEHDGDDEFCTGVDLEILDDHSLFRPPSVFDRRIHRHIPDDEEEEEDDDDEETLQFGMDPDNFVPVFTPKSCHGGISSGSDSEAEFFHENSEISREDTDDGFLEAVESLEELTSFDGVEETGSGFDGLFVTRRSGFTELGRGDGEEGLRFVGFDSETDSDDGQIAVDSGDLDSVVAGDLEDLPLNWDCLRIEEERRDVVSEEFEWEEVDGRVDEREVLSLVIDPDEERPNVQEIAEGVGEEIDTDEEEDDDDDEVEEVVRSIEWEVLLAMNNIDRNSSLEYGDAESYVGDEHDDYVYTSEEYDVLFGQFADHGIAVKGFPPAAKSVVENLSTIVLTEEHLSKNNTLCAVCKEEISLGENLKQLPCLHHYHGECILPWLGMRNTCPVCRYELPSDDVDYENSRTQRSNAGRLGDESRIRYLFDMSAED